ncbi:MAG: septum formation initiator family protein [Anaerolineae bacterium]
MPSATRKRKTIELPIAQFIAVIVLSISLFLIIDFGRRAATGYRVHKEEKRLQVQLDAIQKTNRALLARQDYVGTDRYVEEVARNELKWSKPGETVIIVLATPQVASPPGVPSTLPRSTQQFNTPWHNWLALFFPELENGAQRRN